MPTHSAVIDALFARASESASAERLLDVFKVAFNALWQRARTTLGDVTLTAIANRVLHTAEEKYPLLAPLTLDSSGIDCEGLSPALAPQPLAEALCFVLVEFLTVIGTLTAEILTPALHKALSIVVADEGSLDPTGVKSEKAEL